MKDIYINLEKVNSVDDFHDLVYQVFSFPSYYGRNPNAFWDCITDIFEDTTVHVTGREQLSEQLADFVDQYIDLLKEYEEERNRGFTVMVE
jgi:ribonuclease inhibitor